MVHPEWGVLVSYVSPGAISIAHTGDCPPGDMAGGLADFGGEAFVAGMVDVSAMTRWWTDVWS